ncbi:MAG: glutamate--cysteine ligase [Hyphomonadaceae bacterium]|nr:MAG: glutamate--cysteine ligase [Hyphomonadaceae bacterium]KAF0184253.1 MAG: glutamate--cysteine ligase [Hyphomonadaceae bacterium]
MPEFDKYSPIQNFDDLLHSFQKGCKPKSKWRIGTEHEKFGFYKGSNLPVPYEGDNGIEALLLGMKNGANWNGIYEGDKIIGLVDGMASITLEPGGQFELSGAPLSSIHETCKEIAQHLKCVRRVADPLNIGFLGLGFQPLTALEDVPMMPKGRYQIMKAYMAKVGRLGRQMMFRSCTVQVNLDYSSEADMAQKYRTSMALQPIATALFANSPFAEGRANGYQSYRAQVWTDTDPDRTGTLPFAFKKDFGFADYANYALDVPMYFVKRDGIYHDVSGHSFHDFMAGKLQGFEGQLPTMSDWEDHLTTLFPEVRLKSFLEMRGADGGPWSRLCALPTLFVGLLYDQGALDAASELCKDWDFADVEGLRRAVPFLGMDAKIRGRRVQEIAIEMLEIARAGLNARNALNDAGDNETGFLTELEEIARTGKSPAQSLLNKYEGEWARDIGKIYENCAY